MVWPVLDVCMPLRILQQHYRQTTDRILTTYTLCYRILLHLARCKCYCGHHHVTKCIPMLLCHIWTCRVLPDGRGIVAETCSRDGNSIVVYTWVGIAQLVYQLARGWTIRQSNRGGGRDFRTRPDRSWGPPSLLYIGYWVFTGGKAAGGVNYPPPSSAEVNPYRTNVENRVSS